MSPEDPLTPDRINEQTRKAIAIPLGLGRKERRFFERAQRKGKMTIAPINEVRQLQSVDQLFEVEDLSFCEQELRGYENTLVGVRLNLERYRIYRAVGIPDSSIRSFFVDAHDQNIEKGAELNLWLQADPIRYRQNIGAIKNLEARRKAFVKRVGNRWEYEEDSGDVKEALEQQDIPIEDIFREVLRSKSEKIELIRMQIDWLKDQRKMQDSQSEHQIEQEIQEESRNDSDENVEPKVQTAGQDYSLSGWSLFWTRNRWSLERNHLVSISTGSRNDAFEQLSEVTRGEISIKPISVLRALEFHLQKDVVQKALATRNKYGAEGIREWVKIKRGRDRIFLFVSEEESRVVFFAAGRDVVYRN